MDESQSAVDGLFDAVILDQIRVQSSFMMDGHALVHLTMDQYYNQICHNMEYKISTLIPAENMMEETHTVAVEYPDGWWNAFKAQYLPKYILKRFPVKYTTKKETVTFKAYMLYPKFPEVLRGDAAVQYIMKTVV